MQIVADEDVCRALDGGLPPAGRVERFIGPVFAGGRRRMTDQRVDARHFCLRRDNCFDRSREAIHELTHELTEMNHVDRKITGR